MTEISEKAAQAIVYAIKYNLEVWGLDNVKEARNMAIALAGDVKRIMLKEMQDTIKAFIVDEINAQEGRNG